MLKAWSKPISSNQIARLFDQQYLQNNKLVIILKPPFEMGVIRRVPRANQITVFFDQQHRVKKNGWIGAGSFNALSDLKQTKIETLSLLNYRILVLEYFLN